MRWEIVVVQRRDEKKSISIISVVIDIITEDTTLLRAWDLCTALGARKWKRLSDMIVTALWAIHSGEIAFSTALCSGHNCSIVWRCEPKNLGAYGAYL